MDLVRLTCLRDRLRAEFCWYELVVKNGGM
jgi:hypothetical protein